MEFTKEELELEMWIPVKGYDRYMVSTLGRIKSVKAQSKNKKKRLIREKILKPQLTPQGYAIYRLYYDGGWKQFSGQKIVMDNFVGERATDGVLIDIDHKDNVRDNNRLSNLIYMSHLENVRKIGGKKKGKAVLQYTLDGVLIGEYDHAKASEDYGYDRNGVGKACRGDMKTYRGYIWTFK